MSIREQFGKKLKEIRESKGFTQEQFAELIDYQPQTVSLIESGKRAVSFVTLEKIIEKLNIDPADLFTFEELQKPPALIKNINKQLAELDEASLRYIISVIKQFEKYKNNQK